MVFGISTLHSGMRNLDVYKMLGIVHMAISNWVYVIAYAFKLWANGVVRRFYSPTLLLQKLKEENHHMIFLYKKNLYKII
jgi:hypothetical protein